MELETLKVMMDNLENRIMLPARGHYMDEEKKEEDDVGSNNGSMDMMLLDLEYKAPPPRTL
eukprot:11528648-Ditylum_brightwellii.AAC.1